MSKETADNERGYVINALTALNEEAIDHSQYKRVSSNKDHNTSNVTELSDNKTVEMADLL